MTVYALSLAAGSALGFALFASYANRVARCDALTPVWLSVMIVAGLLLFLLARFNPEKRLMRLGLAIVAGVAIAVGFVAGLSAMPGTTRAGFARTRQKLAQQCPRGQADLPASVARRGRGRRCCR